MKKSLVKVFNLFWTLTKSAQESNNLGELYFCKSEAYQKSKEATISTVTEWKGGKLARKGVGSER